MKLALFLPNGMQCVDRFFTTHMSTCWQVHRVGAMPTQVSIDQLYEYDLLERMVDRMENGDPPHWAGGVTTIETLRNALKNAQDFCFSVDYMPYAIKSAPYICHEHIHCIQSKYPDIPAFYYQYYFDGFVPARLLFF